MISTRRAGQIFEETAAHAVGSLIRTNPRFATHKRPVVLPVEEVDCRSACRPSDVLYEACATHKLDGFMNRLETQTGAADATRTRVLVLGSEYGSFLAVLLRALGCDVRVAEPRSVDELFLPSAVLLRRVSRRVYDTYLAPFVARPWDDRLEWYRGGLLHMNLFQAAAMKTADAFGVDFAFEYTPRPSSADVIVDVGRVVSRAAPPNALVVYLNDEGGGLSAAVHRARDVYPHAARTDDFRASHVRFDAWTERDGCLTPHLRIVQVVFHGGPPPDAGRLERARRFEDACVDMALDALRAHVAQRCTRADVRLVDADRIAAFHRVEDVNLERCLERLHVHAPAAAAGHAGARVRVDEHIELFLRPGEAAGAETTLSRGCVVRVGERYFLNEARPTKYVRELLVSLRPRFVHVEDEAEVEKPRDTVLAATPCFHGCVGIASRISDYVRAEERRRELTRRLLEYLDARCRPHDGTAEAASGCAAKEVELARLRRAGSDL